MADVKISALPAATTPLTGAELVPIVQGGVTEQVTVANLTAGRSVSALDATLTNALNAGSAVISGSSASALVRITQTGAGDVLLVEDSANPDSTPFVVNTDGRLIAGYTATITINSAGYLGEFLGSGVSYPLAMGYTANNATGSRISIVKNRSADWSTNTVVQTSDTIGQIEFAGADGTVFVPAARIDAIVDAAPGASDMPGRLVFLTTADGAVTPTERMRIDSAGRIGIGQAPVAFSEVTVGGTLPSSSNASRGVQVNGTAPTTSTTEVTGFYSNPSTADGITGVTTFYHFLASQGTISGGTRVAPTNQYGFFANSTLTAATNNYGFYSTIAAAAGRWNFFANGTANNAFAGNSRFGGITAPVATVDVTGSVAATTTILSSGATSGIGYATGAGGAVTQGTSRTTGVTLDKITGAITLVSAAGSASYQSFTVTNSTVAATDTIIVNQKSGTDKYIILVTNVSAGSFQITFATTGGTTTEQPVFNFAVIKAVAA